MGELVLRGHAHSLTDVMYLLALERPWRCAASSLSLPPCCFHGLACSRGAQRRLWGRKERSGSSSSLSPLRSPSPGAPDTRAFCARTRLSLSLSRLSEWFTLNITDPATLVAPIVNPGAGYRVINPNNPLLYLGGSYRTLEQGLF